MKKCPFCAEEIQDEAIKCRFCGEFLQDKEDKKQENVEHKAAVIGVCTDFASQIPELRKNLLHYCNAKGLKLIDVLFATSIDVDYLKQHNEIDGIIISNFNARSENDRQYWEGLCQQGGKKLFTDFYLQPSEPVNVTDNFAPNVYHATWENKEIICPSCKSVDVKKISIGKKLGYVAVVGLFAPAFKNVRSQFQCRNCGYKW